MSEDEFIQPLEVNADKMVQSRASNGATISEKVHQAKEHTVEKNGKEKHQE